MDQTSVTGFLQALQKAYDINGVHERAVMWLLPSLMKRTAAAALTVRLSLKYRSWHSGVKGEIVNSSIQVETTFQDLHNGRYNRRSRNQIGTLHPAHIHVIDTVRWFYKYEDIALQRSVRWVCIERNVCDRLSLQCMAQNGFESEHQQHAALKKSAYEASFWHCYRRWLKT